MSTIVLFVLLNLGKGMSELLIFVINWRFLVVDTCLGIVRIKIKITESKPNQTQETKPATE